MILKKLNRQEKLKLKKDKLEDKLMKTLNKFEIDNHGFILGINIDRRLEAEEIQGSIKKIKVWVK